jgi:uncharacterized pyridoxamine 5'-phosphate oxidase family protein
MRITAAILLGAVAFALATALIAIYCVTTKQKPNIQTPRLFCVRFFGLWYALVAVFVIFKLGTIGFVVGGQVQPMQTAHDFLKKAGTYYIATVEGDTPKVRPFGTINLFDGKLWIQTGKKKDFAKQVAANPKVELSAFDGTTWIRVAATLVEDNRTEAQESMLTAYPSLRDMYAVNDGNSVVFYLKDATATFYTFSGEPTTVKF